MLFDVRVLAFDRGQSDTVQSLMRVFKIDEERATHIASSVPRIVKSGAPLETARRLSHILAALGARTEVVAAGPQKKAAVGEGLRSSHVDLHERASQFALPRPSPEALGNVLGRAPANGNGTSTVRSKNVAALKLAKMRAKRQVQEVPANPDKVKRDSSVYMGRVRPGSAPDPSLLRRSNSDLPEGLEADIERPSRVDAEPRPAPRVAEPTFRMAPKPREESSVVRTSSVLMALMLLSLSVLTLGALPALLLGLWVHGAVRRARIVRALEASAVRVSSAQLPELHGQLVAFTEQLGLPSLPRLYVTPAAPRGLTLLATRDAITLMLSAETLAECVDEQRQDVVAFLVAHELSALALGQRSGFRALLRWAFPAVHKLDVLAADARTVQLLGGREHVTEALLALIAGTRALLLLERAEIERQAAKHDAEGRLFTPALPGQGAFLLSRLAHVRRAT